MILYKNGIIRDIKPSRVEEYIAAGWQIEQKLVQEPVRVVEAEEVVLKPPIKSRSTARATEETAEEPGKEEGEE